MEQQLMQLQKTWKINRVHFKDMMLDILYKDKANVLDASGRPILVKIYLIFKLKDQLFILHDNIKHLYIHGNKEMTVSHLKTGRTLLHFTKEEKETIDEIIKRSSDCLEDAIARMSERFVMDRFKTSVSINLKYNVHGY